MGLASEVQPPGSRIDLHQSRREIFSKLPNRFSEICHIVPSMAAGRVFRMSKASAAQHPAGYSCRAREGAPTQRALTATDPPAPPDLAIAGAAAAGIRIMSFGSIDGRPNLTIEGCQPLMQVSQQRCHHRIDPAQQMTRRNAPFDIR
jgi:hypothetical protein